MTLKTLWLETWHTFLLLLAIVFGLRGIAYLMPSIRPFTFLDFLGGVTCLGIAYTALSLWKRKYNKQNAEIKRDLFAGVKK